MKLNRYHLLFGATLLILGAMIILRYAPWQLWRTIAKAIAEYYANDYESATKTLKEALRNEPDSSIAQYDLGVALYKQGKYKEAIEVFKRLLEADDAQRMKWLIHYAIGNCYAKMKRWDDAITAYQRALTLRPDDSDVKHNLELALQHRSKQKWKRMAKSNKPSAQSKTKQRENKQHDVREKERKRLQQPQKAGVQQPQMARRQQRMEERRSESLTSEQVLALLRMVQDREKRVQRRRLRRKAYRLFWERDW